MLKRLSQRFRHKEIEGIIYLLLCEYIFYLFYFVVVAKNNKGEEIKRVKKRDIDEKQREKKTQRDIKNTERNETERYEKQGDGIRC